MAGARVRAGRLAGLILLACGAMLPFMPQASAQQAAHGQDDAVSLLARAQQAARKLDYSGVFTYQQGSHIQSSRIVHVVDGTGERERIEVLDGQPREFLRHNNDVQCLIPEKQVVVREKRRGDRFPGLLADGAPDISGHYRVTVDPAMQRVAGRECRQVDIVPLDDLRYGYRLCVDAKTDLLLKTQTLAARGAVIEQIAFTSLRLGADAETSLLQSSWPGSDWKVYEHKLTPADLAANGWRIAVPPGFMAVEQVTRLAWKGGHEISQLLLSDGMAAISVFIEPYGGERVEPQRLQGGGSQGAVNAYGVRIADFWLTALGEVPLATLRSLAESTEYVPLAVSTQ